MKKLIFLTIIAVVSLGCNSENRDYEKAINENTIEKYDAFLKEYPKSEQSSTIAKKIDDILVETFTSEEMKSSITLDGDLKVFNLSNTSRQQGRKNEVQEDFFEEFDESLTIMVLFPVCEMIYKYGFHKLVYQDITQFDNTRDLKTYEVIISDYIESKKGTISEEEFENRIKIY